MSRRKIDRDCAQGGFRSGPNVIVSSRTGASFVTVAGWMYAGDIVGPGFEAGVFRFALAY
jgi:hypothetical protein